MGELYTMSEARPECIDRGVFCCTAMLDAHYITQCTDAAHSLICQPLCGVGEASGSQ